MQIVLCDAGAARRLSFVLSDAVAARRVSFVLCDAGAVYCPSCPCPYLLRIPHFQENYSIRCASQPSLPVRAGGGEHCEREKHGTESVTEFIAAVLSVSSRKAGIAGLVLEVFVALPWAISKQYSSLHM